MAFWRFVVLLVALAVRPALAGPVAYSACQAASASFCAASCLASGPGYPVCFTGCYASAQAVCAATGIAPTP